jgi:hypothetical protein
MIAILVSFRSRGRLAILATADRLIMNRFFLLQSIQVSHNLQPDQPLHDNSMWKPDGVASNNDLILDKTTASHANTMSLRSLLGEGNATAKQTNTKLLPTGRRYTALSRQILQE